MAAAQRQLSQQQQPFSLVSDSEDFVVIDRSSGSSSDGALPSPQEDSSTRAYQLPLLKQAQSGQSDVQRLSRQIDQVSEGNSNLRRSLSESCVSLERVRDQLKAMRRTLAGKEAELAVMSKQCEKQQAANQKLRDDLSKMTNKQEEWLQTFRDYSKLKNEYNLLTNTKARLESEKADLQRGREEAVAAETVRLRAKFDEELQGALAAERVKWQSELEKQKRELGAERENCETGLKAKHQEAMESMESHYQVEIGKLNEQLTQAAQELNAARQSFQSDLTLARSDSEKALDSERESRRTELAELVAKHQEAMETMRCLHNEEIRRQEQLAAEAKLQLDDCTGRHEAEKNELLEQLKLLNISGFQCSPSLISDFATEAETASLACSTCSTCGRVGRIEALRERAPVSEQGTATPPCPETQEAAVMTDCVSVTASETATSVEMAEAAVTVGASQQTDRVSQRSEWGQTQQMAEAAVTVGASQQTDRVSQRSEWGQTQQMAEAVVSVGASQQTAEVNHASQEIQTEQLEFQVANSDSLQKESAVRHLQMQIATLVQTLRTERAATERIESERKRLQKECEDLRSQLAANQSATSSATSANERLIKHLEQSNAQLIRQLQDKQSELDSVLEDFDVTRNKVYELVEQVKGHESRFVQNDTQAEKLRQKIRELEGQLAIDKEQHNMELDSVRKGDQFKDTKLQAAEKEAEQLRQEVQRLKSVEDELNRRCRDNDQTVQQVMTSAEQDKRRMEEELKKLQSKIDAQTEALEANRNMMENKAVLEMQLREAISDLVDRLKLKAEENDQKLTEANRKQDQLYNRMCDQSEQRMKAEQQLKLASQQLRQANERVTNIERELKQTRERLEESEKFASEMQNYSTNLETELENIKRQLQESSKKRDDTINVAEQLRARFEEEMQRSASIDSELSRLKLEHSKLRADCTLMEQNGTQMLAREHELQTQLAQTQQRLRQAEEAIDVYKGNLQVNQMELDALRTDRERLRVERDELKLRVNRLIEDLTRQEQQAPQPIYDDLLGKHRHYRPPQGGNR